jgi:hypothetical protein
MTRPAVLARQDIQAKARKIVRYRIHLKVPTLVEHLRICTQSPHVATLAAPSLPSIARSARERDWPQVMQTASTWFQSVSQSEQCK